MSIEHSTLRVLVVDDSPFTRQTFSRALRNLGVEDVAMAADGRSALARLQEASADIVICDLNMPEMDGVEFLRHLADTSFRGGVVLVSGEGRRMLSTVETLAGAHDLQVLGAVEKPVRTSELARLLSLDKPAAPRRGPRPDTAVSPEDLRAGIENDELTLFYQPKIQVASREVVGAECLVRWLRADGGMVPPDAFIAVAEAHDLIDLLTERVFEMAVRQGGAWKRQGLELKLSVNISMKNVHRIDFPEYIVGQTEKAGLPADSIILEVTETQLMQDLVKPLEILTRLRLKGVGLSIDDFGTGYASFEQLKSIPFGELKIDRAFVNGAASEPAARAILETTVDLARKLDMTVVAEGAETQEDWDLVHALGIDLLQGYFIARPMPEDAFAAWVSDWPENAGRG